MDLYDVSVTRGGVYVKDMELYYVGVTTWWRIHPDYGSL